MNTIPKPADRDEWLDARRPYFNASSAATLFDRHPFTSLAAVVREKLDGATDDENVHMRRGRHLEHAIAAWWSEEHGLAVYEPEVMYASGPMLATLDRMIVGIEDRAVEIKTTAREIVEPERYWIDQCQAQMYAADLTAVELVAMDSTLRLQTFTIERDDDLIGEMVERATKIMSHITEGRWPPDLDPDPPERHTAEVIELDDDLMVAVEGLEAVRGAIKDLSEDEKRLRTLIGNRLGAAEAGTYGGRRVVTYRSSTRNQLDQRRLRADYPNVAAKYTEPLTIRSLRIVR